jgi:diguanylate cyclase (GGDEF)-like protein
VSERNDGFQVIDFVDALVRRFSYYVVPAAIALFSLFMLISEGSVYRPHGGMTLPFQVVADPESALTPDTARAQLTAPAAPAVTFEDTHLAETPFWVNVAMQPAPREHDLVLDWPSRHLRTLQCWDSATLAPLGSADRHGTQGVIVVERAGFMLHRAIDGLPPQILCRATFSGPARIALSQWPRAQMMTANEAFHHSAGLLEGGLLTLAVFVLMTALINRESRYVLFAAWLVGNLRLGAISMGWDTQWLGRPIDPEWIALTRQITIASYYLLTYTLFTQFFKSELKTLGYGWLLRAVMFSGIVLLALSFVLPFALFLPAMWTIVAFGIVAVVFCLGRIIVLRRSGIAIWYAAALGTVLAASISEVIAAAWEFKGLVGSFNSVTAALASSLMAACAFAEQMREERDSRIDAQRELMRTYDVTPVGLFTLESDGRFVRLNTAMQRKLAMSTDDVDALNWRDFFEPGAWEALRAAAADVRTPDIEIRGLAQPSAEPRWYAVRAAYAGDRIEGSLQDVTERRKATDQLAYLADNDSLTGVLNRRGIERMLDAAVKDERQAHPLALAYLDLDRFKLVNDLYGHQTGDEVLREVCRRVNLVIDDHHSLGRIGGDEFIIVMRDTTMAQAQDVSRRIVAAICDRAVQVRHRAFQIRVSIGVIEIMPELAPQDAIAAADHACRQAKQGARGHIVAYDRHASAFAERVEAMRVIEALGTTFTPHGLFLEMQPIMSLRTPFEALDFEVLLRMRADDGSIVPANRVIAAAESSGHMGELDAWVLDTTLTWMGRNEAALSHTRFVCVNLSGASLNDEAFIDTVFKVLARHRRSMQKLCIEITESVALHDLENSRRFIDRVRGQGAKIALDDFGAGYTSFSYLKALSADALKIDGSFVRSMNQHPANVAIVEAIVELARNLGMRSIAEWAEDAATLETLIELGVDYVQGWAVARPMLPEKLLSGTSAASFITDPEVADVVARIAAPDDGTQALQRPPLAGYH